ncbi:hypothetical protein M2336_001883 [Sphingobium sp. B1D7B]|uniref:beta family protein n=1 Tax=Sphingobium sp. B1D7B TaxID=2940578 RepID=UPI0022255A15|nr:beta family protein [Sphingobium sp. B1D7B]MCW2405254.1 hypothetical protein [Sphingobium sp. B1D7B]
MLISKYFPSLTIRQSEAEALLRLAEPIKDSLFPIVRIQAWPHPKKGEGGPIVRSTDHIEAAYGSRPIGIDLAQPLPPSDKIYKTQDRADWAALGRSEVSALHNPANGYQAWCSFIASDERRIPVVQWTDDAATLRSQVQQLASLNRGLIFRFRRSQGWNLTQAAGLTDFFLGQTHILMIYDFEQIGNRDDLTSIGIATQSAILSSNMQISGGSRTHVFIASSFPSEFTSIGEEYACLAIRERQLYEMLKTSPPLVTSGIDLNYGDHAAIFASERLPAFRGVPRVDYPTPGEWIYHRRREGFQDAARRVRADAKWDDGNLCWGAQRIREAANGHMKGLGAPGRWTTIRMNIHMHVQAQFGDASLSTDEPWVD